jgi:uncharacterized flavoprotein (TIGR03862 family)
MNVAVIGAGPAGLMAAEVAATGGASVTVYEAMPSPARKFLMAGRGGLNLTHTEPPDAFLGRYGSAAERVSPLLDAFPAIALREWAASLGEDTVVGSSGRVFPRSWKASPLLRAWLRRLQGLGVRLVTRHRWTGWESDSLVFEASGRREAVPCPEATILALGGASWPRLGADGRWQDVLAGEGIAIAPLRPANVGLHIGWSELIRTRFAGQPLKRIAVSFGGDSRRGEAVVTKRGLEGGVIYALSGRVRDALEGGSPVTITLDLRPDLSVETLVHALGKPRGRRSLSTFLGRVAGLPPVAIALLREASRDLPEDPLGLATRVKALDLTVTGTGGLERAISSAGGIRWPELDDALMLRRRPGTFAAGEMLDWEAPTGGYLLQACFASGVVAGRGALAHLSRN